MSTQIRSRVKSSWLSLTLSQLPKEYLTYHDSNYTLLSSIKTLTFFNKDPRNSITFWGCSSDNEWFPYYLVNKESKTSKFYLVLPSKTSQDYSRKDECNLIIQKWQMYFQASNFKGRNFLNLNNSKPIQPSYSKEGAWLKYFSLSNSLYAWVTSNLIDSTAHCYTDCCWKEQSNRLKAQVCL